VNAMSTTERLDAPPVSYEQWLAMGETDLPSEVVEGRLIVSPPPTTPHQRAIMRLALALSDAAPPELEVLPEPGWLLRRAPLHVRQPDLAVVRSETVGGPTLEEPPVLAVEILSPTSRERDLIAKRAFYATAGLPWYWLVDLDIPQILVLRNTDAVFVEHASAVGEETLTVAEPFPVRLTPAALR
jgi:Uma2 family endonuclease